MIWKNKSQNKKGMMMNKKDEKKYPKDIDKKSWDKMTNFTHNMFALVVTLGAVSIILAISLLFHRWLS